MAGTWSGVVTTTPAPHPTGQAQRRSGRDPWFDNAKMALVTLVVVGHAWTLLPQTEFNSRLYDFLYAWHMPAFVLVAGYLSRSFRWEATRLWKLVRTVLVPYLVFETALALFRIHVGGEQLEDLYVDPHWPMWFLVALFFWRLATPLFLPLHGGLPLAVVVSLAGGMWATDTLDLARVLGLLPFFVLGLKATPDHWELLRVPAARVLAVGTLATLWVLSAHLDRWAATEWLYYRSRYDELVVSNAEALLTRGTLLLTGTAGALAFLALVPRTGGWFARMGAWTITVYLFHGFFVKAALYAGYGGWADQHPALSLVVTSVAAAALALLLASRPVAAVLDRTVDPFAHAERQVDEAVELRRAGAAARELVGAGAGPPRPAGAEPGRRQ